jgi:hypothetical protein
MAVGWYFAFLRVALRATLRPLSLPWSVQVFS